MAEPTHEQERTINSSSREATDDALDYVLAQGDVYVKRSGDTALTIRGQAGRVKQVQQEIEQMLSTSAEVDDSELDDSDV